VTDPPLSYAQTLAVIQERLESLPPADPTSFDLALTASNRTRRRRRGWAASALIFVVAVWAASVLLHPIPAALCDGLSRRVVVEMGLLPAGNVLLCLTLLRRDGVGAQMFVRACCWSYLVLGALGSTAAPGLLPWSFPAAAFGCGMALFALGDDGLRPEHYRGVFRPVAHRTALTWTMVLAVAHMQTLLAVNQANLWQHTIDVACGMAMVVAVVGLYRLRVWGLACNVGANLVIATLAVTGRLLGVPPAIAWMLAATALVQLVLVGPLLRSFRQGRVREAPRLQQAAALFGRLAIAALVLLGLVTPLIPAERRGLHSYCAAQLFDHPVTTSRRD